MRCLIIRLPAGIAGKWRPERTVNHKAGSRGRHCRTPANRADFVARVLRVLNQDLEEITNPHAGGFEEMVKELGSKK